MVSGIIRGAGAVSLFDKEGVELTASVAFPSWYKLTFAGAGTDYAYLSGLENSSNQIIKDGKTIEIGNIRVVSTNAVSLTFALQMNVKNAIADAENWQPLPAYDATFAGANAQKANSVYQQAEYVFDTPTRIAITVDGATTVWLQVTTPV